MTPELLNKLKHLANIAAHLPHDVTLEDEDAALKALHGELAADTVLELIALADRTTAPVSLTDEQITDIADDNDSGRTMKGNRLFSDRNLLAFARALLAAAPNPAIALEPWAPSEEQFEQWRARHGLHHSHNEAFYDAASLYLEATPPALAGSQVQAAGDARKRVARAIWNLRREDEDRCDMELEDMGDQHSVWAEADAAIAAMREQQT